MATHTLVPRLYHCTFGPHEPALRVKSGDTVTAETRDCHGLDSKGSPIPDSMLPIGQDIRSRPSNPVVGPIHVEEARVGDLLAVRIEEIRLNGTRGMSKQSERFGSLSGEWTGHSLLYSPPIETRQFDWTIDPVRRIGSIDLPGSRLGRVEVPLVPFIGSIGVCPPMGRIETTMAPGEFGGNMDFRRLGEGVTLYLPVWIDGAYLAFGDVHALQGDGEINGTAVEVTAVVTLGLRVVKSRPAAWPRAEDDDYIMTIGSTRPLDDCVRLACTELLAWLVADYGFQREEAWQLMGQLVRLEVANFVDPFYSVAARFPKKYLPK
jgi:amidase